MSLLDRLPDDLRLRVVDLLPAQDRAKLALLSKACQMLSLSSCSAFSMTWDEEERPKLFNLLDWLAQLAQHSQHTLLSLELHCTNMQQTEIMLPRKLIES